MFLKKQKTKNNNNQVYCTDKMHVQYNLFLYTRGIFVVVVARPVLFNKMFVAYIYYE